MSLAVRFWGVRGSIACPSAKHVEFGGNTSCIELLGTPTPIILDSGTGIRKLGETLLERDVKRAHILLTHTHWDHINGFPFFRPAYEEGRSFHIMAGHLKEKGGVQRVLAGQMTAPMFPVPLENLRADFDFDDFEAGATFDLDGTVVKTAALNHPDGATGYRIEQGGKSVCYVTDTEHVPGRRDERIVRLIENADLLIYDSTYTDEEYLDHVGWGHSTWQEGVRLCKEAGVDQLAIFHHEPDHEDDFMRQVEIDAKKEMDRSLVAKEGMLIEL
ncbi:MAG: MBL fold metallo-hydrolase [Myxococcota bacterium]